MATAARIVGTLVLLGIAAFCGFGFLATFEPPGWITLRAVYGVVGVLSLLGVVWMWLPRR